MPLVNRGMGESLVGPVHHRARHAGAEGVFLPRIISGEDRYCQGFSEPDHGSDLAAVETRGVVEGDEVVITGQKVWTSGAARANRMFVLCRTDPDGRKHAGLSYVLIDFTGQGIEFRPIKQMSGAAEFCEDFLDGVRAPLFNVIGGLGNGWRVAMTTLGHERGGRATVHTSASSGSSGSWWRRRASTARPPTRSSASSSPGPTRTSQLMRQRPAHVGPLAAGRPPGPEASVAKLFWSEYHKRLGEIAVAIEGSEALLRPDGDGYATTPGRTCS